LTKKVIILFLALAALISVCAAQYYTPTQANDNAQDGSVPGGMPEGASATDNASAPTDTRPQAGDQPQTLPETSTGEAASELGQGQSLTQEQVTSFGQVEEPGEARAAGLVGGIIPSGIQYRVLYNGIWSYGPAALSAGQQTNMLVSVDQPQQIWSYEKYPSGYEVWEQWGYWSPGDYNAWFYGDVAGWHLVAIYGETSGWSNAVWIYVAPESPFVASEGPQPVLSETEVESEASDVSEIQP
jgi:hypothetical protein